MKRNTLNYLIDGLTALSLIGVALTGLVLKFVLPPGSQRAGWTLFDMRRHEWGDVHFWTTVALGALLLVHVVLHWQWICVTTSRLVHRGSRPSARARSLIGAVVLVLVAGGVTGAIFAARQVVQVGERPPHRTLEPRDHNGSESIRDEGAGERRRRGGG